MSKDRKMSRKRFCKLMIGRRYAGGRVRDVRDTAEILVRAEQLLERAEHAKIPRAKGLRAACGRLCWKEIWKEEGQNL